MHKTYTFTLFYLFHLLYEIYTSSVNLIKFPAPVAQVLFQYLNKSDYILCAHNTFLLMPGHI